MLNYLWKTKPRFEICEDQGITTTIPAIFNSHVSTLDSAQNGHVQVVASLLKNNVHIDISC